jgi:hypothetical protein
MLVASIVGDEYGYHDRKTLDLANTHMHLTQVTLAHSKPTA